MTDFGCEGGGEGEGAGVLIISHSSPYSRPPCWEQSQQAPIYASTGRLHGNLRGSGVAGKGCFYLLMRSVPGAPCLSASVSQHLPCAVEGGGGGGGAAAMNACQVTRMPSSLISTPGLQAALFKCEGWEGLLALGSAL